MPSALTCRVDTASLSLGTLRRQLGVSQADLARRLQVSQPHIAQLENQADMHLNTLQRYLSALGCQLELQVRFPDDAPGQGRAPQTKQHQRPSGSFSCTIHLAQPPAN